MSEDVFTRDPFLHNIKIFRENGNIIGTGFLTSKSRIIACINTLEVSSNGDINLPHIASTFLLNFRYQSNQELCHLDFSGVKEIDRDNVDGLSILNKNRLLELDLASDAPVEEIEIPKVILHEKKMEDRRCQIFVYTDDTPQGISLDGKITGTNIENGTFLINLNNEFSFSNYSGVIGSPIYDVQSCSIVGIVISNFQNQNDQFLGLSIRKVIVYLPELAEDIVSQMESCYRNGATPILKPDDIKSELLNSLWSDFTNEKGWHKFIEEKCDEIFSVVSNYPELENLNNVLRHVPFSRPYPEILSYLLKINQVIDQLNVFGFIDKKIHELEKQYGKTLKEIYESRTFRLGPEEQIIVDLDSLKPKLYLFIKIAESPEFTRCFLITGDLGSGKTHFINMLPDNEINRYRKNFIIYIRSNDLSKPLPELICREFSDIFHFILNDLDELKFHLDHINNALNKIQKNPKHLLNYQGKFIADTLFKIIVVMDDVSLFSFYRKGFLGELIQLIKSQSDFHEFYWLITSPIAYYPNIVEATASFHYDGFWNQYGQKNYSESDQVLSIEKWISMDNINEIEKTGIKIIREKNPESAINYFGDDIEAIDPSNYKFLFNPFIAKIWVASVPNQSKTALNINYLEFIEKFKNSTFRELLLKGNTLSNKHTYDLDHLKQFAILTGKYCMSTGSFSPFKTALLEELPQLSKKEHKFKIHNFEIAEEIFRIVSNTELLIKVVTNNDSVEVVYLRFLAIWQEVMARYLKTKYQKPPDSSKEIEEWFQDISPIWKQGILEYLLLMGGKEHEKDTEKGFKYFKYALKSSALPESSVWLAGGKTRKEIQIKLISLIDDAIKNLNKEREIGGKRNSLFTLMYFINEIDLTVMDIPSRFQYYQKMYSMIHEESLDWYLLFITERLINFINTEEDLLKIYCSFSGSEELLPEVMNRIAGVLYQRLLVIINFENYDLGDQKIHHLGKFINCYLQKIISEYKDFDDLEKARRTRFGAETLSRDYFLFRERILSLFIDTVIEHKVLKSYEFLKEINWYSNPRFSHNYVLLFQMEEIANLAIGKAIRENSSLLDDYVLILKNLSESDNPIDYKNAAWIIYHTVPSQNGIQTGTVNEELLPIFKYLHKNKSWKGIINAKKLADLFRIIKS